MRRQVDLSDMDEPDGSPAELLEALPEIRHEIDPLPADDDLGLRSLLERPESFAHAWWRNQASRSARPAPWRPV
jgi:hypothetical protein